MLYGRAVVFYYYVAFVHELTIYYVSTVTYVSFIGSTADAYGLSRSSIVGTALIATGFADFALGMCHCSSSLRALPHGMAQKVVS